MVGALALTKCAIRHSLSMRKFSWDDESYLLLVVLLLLPPQHIFKRSLLNDVSELSQMLIFASNKPINRSYCQYIDLIEIAVKSKKKVMQFSSHNACHPLTGTKFDWIKKKNQKKTEQNILRFNFK